MDFDSLFPSRFMKAGQFNGRDVTLTIKDVTLEKLPGKKQGEEEVRGVVSFEKTDKQLVLNKTNAICLRAMFGRETSEWHGKRVTFYAARIAEFEGNDIAVRVRGSPDIDAAIPAVIDLPRKKPYTVTLTKTVVKSASASPAPKAAAQTPSTGKPNGRPKLTVKDVPPATPDEPQIPSDFDPKTGEVFDEAEGM